MQHLEVSGAVRHIYIYISLGFKRLMDVTHVTWSGGAGMYFHLADELIQGSSWMRSSLCWYTAKRLFVVSYRRFGISYWPNVMPRDFGKYKLILRNIPAQRKSHLHPPTEALNHAVLSHIIPCDFLIVAN